MKIYVDADACPTIRQTEQLAKKYALALILICDTNHILHTDYGEVVIVGAGADAVDLALINRMKPGDIVVTQDYGVAAMALGKKCYAIHQNGFWYTEENMPQLLEQRHLVKKLRRASGKNHVKGPKKRTAQDDALFCDSLERLIRMAMGLV